MGQTQFKSYFVSSASRNPPVPKQVRASQNVASIHPPPRRWDTDADLKELLAENVAAKLVRVAQRDLKDNTPPIAYPECVPQDGPKQGQYELRESAFWTCGFFPGSLYTLLERMTKYPELPIPQLPEETLLSLCRAWAEPLHGMATRTDTHDLGFIIEPALRLDWELTGNRQSLESLITAAHSLASRYEASAGAIRSWDLIRKKDLEIISMTENFIIIIDSMCNLSLLFYAAAQSNDSTLATIAQTHAYTLLRTHLRPVVGDKIKKTKFTGPIYSTCHVANIDPRTGVTKQRLTAQGYSAGSTWARGQAWGILGYAQTYSWTNEHIFLEAACGLAEYFLQRLAGSGYKVPLWDFDAPIEDPERPVFDSSAGAIAAYGMLLLSESLKADQQFVLADSFYEAALDVLRALLQEALAVEKAKFAAVDLEKASGDRGVKVVGVEDVHVGKTFDSILKNATANNNVGANRRYFNHGLVYADYYLLQCSNQLLKMGSA